VPIASILFLSTHESDSDLSTGKYVAALRGFEKTLELDPTCMVSKYQVACTKLLLGLTEEAALQFKGALASITPFHSSMLPSTAQTLSKNRDLKEQGGLLACHEGFRSGFDIAGHFTNRPRPVGPVRTIHHISLDNRSCMPPERQTT